MENWKKNCNFFCSTDREWQHIPSKSFGKFLFNGISCHFIEIYTGFDIFSLKFYSVIRFMMISINLITQIKWNIYDTNSISTFYRVIFIHPNMTTIKPSKLKWMKYTQRNWFMNFVKLNQIWILITLIRLTPNRNLVGNWFPAESNYPLA